MKTMGIIAEYNPFHNGHAYHISQAKKITGADYCIVIMSGNYVQRGVPAVMDKTLRTRAALMCGADLVIELPVHYASASAEYFANGAVALLNRLGVIDCLCFGSECGSLDILLRLCDALLSENAQLKSLLQQSLKSGYSYPQARTLALNAVFPELSEELSHLQQPNNILGIEYLKAIKKQGSHIIPYTISRKDSGYHDTSLHTDYSSALAIRNALAFHNDISFIKESVPPSVYEMMTDAYQKFFPLFPDDFSPMLAYKLIQEAENGFDAYFDIDKDFSNKIKKRVRSFTDFSSFCDTLKSKNMTYTRVSRNLLHILLDIYQSDIDLFCLEGYVFYAKILGLKKSSAPLLSKLKAEASIPLISKLADAARLIPSELGRKMLTLEIRSDEIYRMRAEQKFHCRLPNEYQREIVTV